MDANDLKSIWKGGVKRFFNEERINSERALQAIMYLHLSQLLSPEHAVFVEPGFPSNPGLSNYVPDLIVVNRAARTVECVIEIKCMPHWWLTSKKIEHDMNKLAAIAALGERFIKLDVFGPNRILRKDGSWKDGRPKYQLKIDTIFVLAAIARIESECELVDRNKFKHSFANDPRFLLMSAAVDPEHRTAQFTVS